MKIIQKIKYENGNRELKFLGLNLYSKKINNAETIKKYFFNIVVSKSNINTKYIKLFWLFNIRKNKLQITNVKTNYWLKYILNKIDKNHDDIYITFNACGESYFFMQAFSEICKKQGSKNPAIVTVRNYHNVLADMYTPNTKKYYIPECWKLFFNKKYVINKYKHRFFLVLPLFHYQEWEDNIKKDNSLHYYTSFLNVFGLKEGDVPIKDAKISDEIHNKMLAKMKEINLDVNNFIFILPESVSNPSLGFEFWQTLDKELRKIGYDLFYNVFQNNVALGKVKTCFLDKCEVQALCKMAKAVIGIKSGLIEPLCTIDIPIISLYTSMYARPDANLKPMNVKDHMRACSNKKIPCINSKNIYEFDAENTSYADLCRKILDVCAPKRYLNYIETHIVDHCNLNCRACCHYCNVSSPNFINIIDFENDFKELSKKFMIRQIRLMGGEPLLHPNINDFLVIARKYFPNSDIRLVSNGILLGKMDEEFWNTIEKTNIKIDLTKYPIGGTSFSEALDSIGKHVFNRYRDDNLGYYVQKNSLGGIWVASYFQLTMDSRGLNNIEESFKKCPYKRCINLVNGKLTHCPTAAYIKNYNKYFNKNLASEDGIDIYKNSAQDILNYLSAPIETCKYCTFDESVKFESWQVSKKDENEWFVNKEDKVNI